MNRALFLLFFVAISATAAAPLRAQFVADAKLGIALANHSIAQVNSQRDTLSPTRHPSAVDAALGRFVLSSLGWVAGAAVGGRIGVNNAPDCHCEFQGWEQGLVGVAVGGAIGASLGAGLPRLGSTCSAGARVTMALGGAVLGTVAGTAMVAASTHQGGGALAWAGVAMPAFGATAASQLCRGWH